MTSTNDTNLQLQADDSRTLRSVIRVGDKSSLVKILSGKGVSVNSSLTLYKYETTSLLHLTVNVIPDNYHPDIVDYLLTEGAECNSLDSGGYAPVHYAVIRKNIAALKTLLDAGADVNLQVDPPIPSYIKAGCGHARGEMLNTRKEMMSYPLHLAVRTCHANSNVDFISSALIAGEAPKRTDDQKNYDLIKLLLSQGADCNLIDGNKQAPLHYAVSQSDEYLTALILDAGANINILSEYKNQTPLYSATTVPMLKFLLSRNADPEIIRWDGNSILHWFVSNGQINLTRHLLADVSVGLEVENTRHQSPLAIALSRKDDESVHLLMNAGCDPASEVFKVNERNSWIYTPEGEELMNIMKEVASNPRTLVDLSTFAIRRILKKNITSTVDSLPLPAKFRQKITLNYL